MDFHPRQSRHGAPGTVQDPPGGEQALEDPGGHSSGRRGLGATGGGPTPVLEPRSGGAWGWIWELQRRTEKRHEETMKHTAFRLKHRHILSCHIRVEPARMRGPIQDDFP